jgi:hypothetical protein
MSAPPNLPTKLVIMADPTVSIEPTVDPDGRPHKDYLRIQFRLSLVCGNV